MNDEMIYGGVPHPRRPCFTDQSTLAGYFAGNPPGLAPHHEPFAATTPPYSHHDGFIIRYENSLGQLRMELNRHRGEMRGVRGVVRLLRQELKHKDEIIEALALDKSAGSAPRHGCCCRCCVCCCCSSSSASTSTELVPANRQAAGRPSQVPPASRQAPRPQSRVSAVFPGAPKNPEENPEEDF